MRITASRTLCLALMVAAILLYLTTSLTPSSKTVPPRQSPSRQVIAPDTVVLTLQLMADGKADAILPVGGLYKGKWLSGEAWRYRLPKRAQAGMYSLTQGRVGTLRITGPAHLFEPPEFSGWRGTYEIKNSDTGLAIWKRSGPPLKWAKATWLPEYDPQYYKIAHNYMMAHGLPQYLTQHNLSPQLEQRVEVTQVIAVDLDYDGKKETLLSAIWSELNGPSAPDIGTAGVGSRSYLLLARGGNGKTLSVIALSGPEEDFTKAEEVIGCVDIDLDKKAEVITTCPTAHAGFRIYTWSPPKIVAHYEFFYGE